MLKLSSSLLMTTRPFISMWKAVRAHSIKRSFHQSRASLSTEAVRPLNKPLTVLALESSADDSCCAIVTSKREILANVVIKQHLINAKYGGIHPIKAQEAHDSGIPLAIAQALREAQMRVDDVDAIAYTRGPGMYGCLSIAAASAKALAAAAGKPLYGIHHMQAHTLTPLLTESTPPEFPFLVLLVSGGHTQLVLGRDMDSFRVLCGTLDNSVGDAFDKVARILNLPTSSSQNPGAVLEHYAALPPLSPFDTAPLPTFPVPLTPSSSSTKEHRRAFSFAGLLSHTERVVKRMIIQQRTDKGNKTVVVSEEAMKREVARCFQVAAVQHLCRQIKGFLNVDGGEEGRGGEIPVRSLVVSGGVASNMFLRARLQEMAGALPVETSRLELFYPPLALCTDNAAMIAWTAILRMQDGAVAEGYDLPLRRKWSLEDLYDDLPAK